MMLVRRTLMPVVDPAAIQVAKDEVPGCTDVWFSQTTHTEGTVTVVRRSSENTKKIPSRGLFWLSKKVERLEAVERHERELENGMGKVKG